jgi:RES domain-containing protein
MMTTAWRVIKKKHLKTAFTGEGAKLYGGRWNPRGYAAIYLAQHLSLAILELIVHLDAHDDINAFRAIAVTFDQGLAYQLPKADLPKNWFKVPVPEQPQAVGKAWIEAGRHLILEVPSVVVPGESNFVVNPRHPDFAKLGIGSPQPLHIDIRLAEAVSLSREGA